MTQSFKLNGRSIILGFSSLALTLFAGYLGLNAAGVIGGPPKLTEAELKAGLQEYADTINVEGGLYFDTWSRLVRAKVVSNTINITGQTEQKFADLHDGYHSSRIAQGKNKLCRDALTRNLLRSGGRVWFYWHTADDQLIGEKIKFDDDEVCGDIPIPKSE